MVFMDAVARACFWSCPIATAPKIRKLRFFKLLGNSPPLTAAVGKCCCSDVGAALLGRGRCSVRAVGLDGVLWPGDGKDNGAGDGKDNGTGHKPDYGGATAVLPAVGA